MTIRELFLRTGLKDGREMGRFFSAGFIVTALDCGLYFFLFRFLPLSVAKAISFACAGGVGYFLNARWTFKQSQSSYTEVGRYILISILAWVLNVLTNQAFLFLWPTALFLAFACATALTSVATFVSFKWWVFRPRSIKKGLLQCHM
jgi:putative flippase GtrA